ncbi:MAG: hypothetical protein ACI9YH_003557 [Colwellia sp.]|jgi:hypothetical protein
MKKVTSENKKNKPKVSKTRIFVNLIDKVDDLKNLKTVSYAFYCRYKGLTKNLAKLFP